MFTEYTQKEKPDGFNRFYQVRENPDVPAYYGEAMHQCEMCGLNETLQGDL